MPIRRIGSKENADAVLAEKHLALICQRALFWWRFLPASVKAWYDADDMVSDCVLHVCRRSARYDAAKARETTWIHCVVDNYCKALLSHHGARKYSDCETVEMGEDASKKLRASDSVELRESKDVVERVIAGASEGLRDFLSKIFDGGRIERVPAWELLERARGCGATCDDFERVFRAAVG